MAQLEGGISRSSPTTELEIIRQKRVALQKLVSLTSTLHRLNQGLQSVILMGRSAAQIPEKIINKFKSLSEGLKDKPIDTLQNTLTATDRKIQRDIKHVLEISQKSDALLEQQLGASGEKLVDVLKDDYHEYVNGFKKKSQTSITLRIALKTRNVIVSAFNLPVPESFIEHQIVSLNHKEDTCRKVIKTNMLDLQNDINQLMRNRTCSEDQKQLLAEIQTDLQGNYDHFISGKSIEEMPMLYESIELSGAPQIVEEVEEIINPTEHSIEQAAEATPPEEPEIRKRGFFRHLWIWLKSPMDMGWKDTQ
ncbi:hypothetical protein MNBD_GAMMA11-2247 [hydrothermal vent metagenome]|uniref:Uncharacterized protein n=1 Tax=hydrothermal vent metagenome TaxID=652676 RepID=A0A3B0X0J1_9ZZZZ